MVDVRKIIIIFVVAILFSVLVFSVIEAAYPQPRYEDFCRDKFSPRAEPINIVKDTSECPDFNVPETERKACEDKHGFIQFTYDSKGCAESFECNTCSYELDQSMENYNQVVFYVSAILALIAIFVGMFLPATENSLNEWIGTGFMLGGAFALFFGTARTFSDLGRFVRPVVIFIELALVIFIAYRKIGNLRADKKK